MKALEVIRRDYLKAKEPTTTIESALVRERYLTLQRQIPIIYLLAVVAVCGLQFTIEGYLAVGLNPPTVLAGCAVFRLFQWLRRPAGELSINAMWRRLQQTTWLTLVICFSICLWCLYSAQRDTGSLISILLFAGLTALGAAFGLSSHPSAARIPLVVVALPLSAAALLSSDLQFVAAAVSLAVVALLLLRLVEINSRNFDGLITSRVIINREQKRTELALSAASTAATTDFLTSLPNRRAFVAALATKLDEARAKPKSGFALALVDLDRFKFTNDSFGHSTGDQMLRTVAARLTQAVPEKVLVARLGGDEFAIILPDLNELDAAKLAGDRVMALLNGPVEIDGSQFIISACCGLTLVSFENPQTSSSVLAHADIALYHAKTSGSGQLAVFKPEMEAPRKRRAQIERALQLPSAFANIDLVFQPIVELRTGRVSAHEALARWTEPQLGSIEPADFIPVAEQLNLIRPLSGHLFEKALFEAIHWPEPIKLSFNLSAIELCSTSSAQLILKAMRDSGFDPTRLQVEVTETALLGDFATARKNLHALKLAGVLIILDDFGAGYASISYLKEIQFDLIKLDGSLIASSRDTLERQRLLAALLGFCRAMQIPCVAEHVESEEQFEMLLGLGCEFGQGYWLAKPTHGAAVHHVTHMAGHIKDVRSGC